MIESDNGYEEKINRMKEISRELTQKLPFHNYGHEVRVADAADYFGELAGLDYRSRALLRTAGVIHDIVVVVGRKDNEERSVEIASRYLHEVGYSKSDIDIINSLVMATKMPQQPKDLLEQIICDSDLDHLGREDFLAWGDYLRLEWGLPADKKWYEGQIAFLENHKYHTEVARNLLDSGKNENVQKLRKRLEGFA
jgi:predicted metal-dependent HD superfamily phosphohydrolase